MRSPEESEALEDKVIRFGLAKNMSTTQPRMRCKCGRTQDVFYFGVHDYECSLCVKRNVLAAHDIQRYQNYLLQVSAQRCEGDVTFLSGETMRVVRPSHSFVREARALASGSGRDTTVLICNVCTGILLDTDDPRAHNHGENQCSLYAIRAANSESKSETAWAKRFDHLFLPQQVYQYQGYLL